MTFKYAKSYIDIVKEVLWEQWDPIGVCQFPEAFGEYDAYAPAIAGMIMQGANEVAVAQALNRIISDRMGLGEGRDSVETARILIDKWKKLIETPVT